MFAELRHTACATFNVYLSLEFTNGTAIMSQVAWGRFIQRQNQKLSFYIASNNLGCSQSAYSLRIPQASERRGRIARNQQRRPPPILRDA